MSQFSVATNGTINGNTGSATLPITLETANTNVIFSSSGNTITLDFAPADHNILIGADYSNVAGEFNTSIGYATLQDVDVGTHNVAIGYAAGFSIRSGDYNVLIGSNAGVSYTSSETENICILNAGEVGESNTTRIGLDTTIECYMYGTLVNVGGRRYNVTIIDDPEILPYQMTHQDHVIEVLTDEVGSAILYLPASPKNGDVIIVKDLYKSAGSFNITIRTSDGSKIDGQDEYIIDTDYGSVQLLFCNGVGAFGFWGVI